MSTLLLRCCALALLLPAAALLLAPPASAGFIQSFQATGTLGLEVTGAANLNPGAGGTVTLSSSTLGAVIQRAYLYATQVNNTSGMSGTFAGQPLMTTGPYASDALLITLSTYRWDVTSMIIPGVNSYNFALLDGVGSPVAIAGVGLVVVWSRSSEPMRTVTIADGVQQVGESGMETESMTFTNLPAGSTAVWVFTTDDDGTTINESIAYNSNNIGGPLVGNLGLNASVLQMSASSVMGANTLAITTVTDHLTWVLGATAVTLPPVGIEPSSWGNVKSGYR
jgi:hypothetical protein